jgi:hypothetical protein
LFFRLNKFFHEDVGVLLGFLQFLLKIVMLFEVAVDKGVVFVLRRTERISLFKVGPVLLGLGLVQVFSPEVS